MKTNVFHSKRQASCDVLLYPITPVFLYFLDVTKPGGFTKEEEEEEEIKRETEQIYSYNIMQPPF